MMALVLFSITVNAHDFKAGRIFYEIISEEDGTIAVTYEGTDKYNPDSYYTGEIRIPDHVSYYGRRYTVTRIGERAFMNCDSLISVSLPESIERIERLAFDGCRNLKEIKMPSKANHIGSGAFNSCKQLEAIRIPEGVTILYYTTFWDCNNLKSIILPNSLTTIENGVFVDCDSLSTITFPDSLVKIGNYTFGYCDALDSITIPASVTDIGTEPFGHCNNLKSLQVVEGNPKYDSRDNCNAIIETATNKLAVGCAATIIPEGITTLGTYAFCGIYLPEIVLPNSIQVIEEMAIRECTLQSPLIIPDGVKRMDEYALYINTVDSIIVRGQIARIEKNTFEGCTSTDVIDLPESVEYIGDGAFARCASLNKLICRAATPPQCGSRAFDGMNRNSTLEVPEESVSLYENANGWKSFLNIKSIGSTDVVELPDSNRNIVKKGHGTYYATEDGECTYLFSYDYNAYIERLDSTECFKWYGWNPIVIDVDTIGPNAFVGCSFNDGQVIYLTEKVKVICKDAFTRINIRPRITADVQITDNLTLVFEGAKPPRIADNKIMDYTSNSCYINFVVPDLDTYIKSDLQWTYTQIMTIEDLLNGRPSLVPWITALETAEADVVVDFDKLAPSGAPMMYATVRPRKEVPVRIGTEGDTIYSPAPVWQNYKMQVQVVNDDGCQYFGGEWRCGADEQCNLTIELSNLPDSNYVYFLSRCIAPHAASSSWTRIKVQIRKEEPKTYLVTEGKQWAVYYEQSWNQDQPVVTHTFRLQGDTVINGFTYKKKWMSVEKDLSDWSLFPSYMREENGKVYVMNSRGEEALWFDYNAQVGDTLCLTSKQATQQCYGLVTSIDDVVLEHSDGKQRKRYEVVLGREAMSGGVYFTDECIYIHEDVGMFNSPTYGYGLGDHTLFNYGNKLKLLCVHDNGIALYQSPDGCYKEATSKTYLVTEGKQWAVERYTMGGVQGVYSYCLQGDTIINGKEYKIEHEGCGKDLSGMKPSGRYMREENGRVYSYVHTERYKDEDEVLFFDFNLEDGDTIVYIPDVYSLHVMDVYDAVVPHSDGQSRKCYEVELWNIREEGVYDSDDFGGTFVEGIGNLCSGLSDPGFGLVGSNQRLLYVKQGDTILYQREEEKEEPILPIAVDGMEWEIKVGQSYYFSDVQMWIDGDVTVDNIPCKRLYTRTTQLWDGGIEDLEIGYCYQDGDKYYQNGKLMFDFGLDVGDMFTTVLGNKIMVSNVSDTILNDGVKRKMLTVKYSGRTDKWVEGIGSLTMGIYTNDFTTYGVMKELQSCSYNGEYIYDKNLPDPSRPTTKRGYGIYHGDTYLHAYTINEAEAVTDSTDFARWYDKTVIYFDVDTIGPNAFSGATFRQGQILYFTERLNTIFKDAFTDVNIVPRTSKEMLVSDDLTLVFAGANPPGIDKNYIMDYADSTCHINYVVPDLETYIKDDIQWTYTTLMTIDDFVRGYVSPENEVTVSDTTEADASVDNAGENGPTAPPTIRASVRPRGDIPVRIGEGENKDIYSRAPAWQYYTVEVVVTDCHADTLYTASQECRAHGQCDFVIELPYYPDGGYVYLHSRSIDMFGRATEWAVLKVQVDTAIDELLLPGTPNVYYDLQGRPVANPTRGIYIRNGRKVVVVR